MVKNNSKINFKGEPARWYFVCISEGVLNKQTNKTNKQKQKMTIESVQGTLSLTSLSLLICF